MRNVLNTTRPVRPTRWSAWWLLAAICAFGMPGFPTSGLISSAYAYEANTDRPGGDYRNFEIGKKLMNYIDPCERACSSEAQCKAWTVVKPGIQGVNARCWLKSVVPPAVGNACCSSGLPDRSGSPSKVIK